MPRALGSRSPATFEVPLGGGATSRVEGFGSATPAEGRGNDFPLGTGYRDRYLLHGDALKARAEPMDGSEVHALMSLVQPQGSDACDRDDKKDG